MNETTDFPKHWWEPQFDQSRPDWEILPGEVHAPQLVLSKRNELGILSNLAHTPFVLDDVTYQSIEALWQSCKLPEDQNDPRAKFVWPCQRQEIFQMYGLEAKRRGDQASLVMKENTINWVTYQGQRWVYPELEQGPFYHLIFKAMKIKLQTYPEIKRLLLKTKNLVFVPDHHQFGVISPAHEYHKIWMLLREQMS